MRAHQKYLKTQIDAPAKEMQNCAGHLSKPKLKFEAEIARTAEQQISKYVLLGGDLNDTPDNPTLAPLFVGQWVDIQDHESYPSDRPGTYGTGRASDKIDYLIMSPQLRLSLLTTGIERRGSYHPHTWAPFDTVTGKSNEASDHHLIWADFSIGA